MTAKTTRGRDVSDDARAESAAQDQPVEELDEVEAKPAARVAPRKRVRRVRVIEVIDDGEDGEDPDLEGVLEALDEEDAHDAHDAETLKAAKAAKAEPTKAEPTKAEPTKAESATVTAESVKAEPAEVKLAKAEPAKVEPEPVQAEAAKAGAGGPEPGAARWRTLLGSATVTRGLVVVLVVVLAGLLAWQWQQAAGLSAKEQDRRDVAKVAGAYGNAVYSYTPATAQAGINENIKLLGGDLLASYRQTTAANLPGFFQKSPKVSMSSKIKQVFVGDVNGELATAVILIDVQIQTDQGPVDGSNTMLRLALKKEQAGWKITQQKTSGESDEAASTGQLPLPSGGPSTSPAPSGSPKTP